MQLASHLHQSDLCATYVEEKSTGTFSTSRIKKMPLPWHKNNSITDSMTRCEGQNV